MKQIVNQLAFIFCKASGLNIFMRFRNRKRARVLMYHAVSGSAPDSSYWTVVTTEQFRRQLHHLKKCYRTVGGKEFAAGPADQLANSVLITFDDGHVNTLTTALPELRRFGHPAICFVIPGLSEAGKMIWADELHTRMIDAAPAILQTSLGEIRLDSNSKLRTTAVDEFIERMKSCGNKIRLEVIDEIKATLPIGEKFSSGALQLMSKEQIVQLSNDELIDIGTHTDSHPILSSLPAEEQIQEIQAGLDRLRSWGVDGAIAFAYPNGRPCDYDLDSIDAVRTTGIQMAFTTSDGFIDSDDAPYEYKRIPVGDETSQYEFEARLSGAYYLLRRLSGRGEQAALRRKSRAVLISSKEELAGLKADWDRLVEETPRNTIFQRFDWLMAWWEVHGVNRELFVLGIEEDGRLIGLAPFMIIGEVGRRTVEFIGTPDADYGNFIGPNPEKIVREAVNWLLDHDEKWDQISLAQVSELSPTYAALRKILNETGAHWFAKPMATCYRLNYTGEPENRKDFRVKHSRSLRNLINRLKRLGEYKFEIIRDAAQIKTILPELFHMHISRWAESMTPSYFEEETNRRFIETLVDRFAPKGNLFLCVSRVDNLPVCYTLNFEAANVMTGYTLAYNEFFFRYSPGRMHGVLQCEYMVQIGYDLDLSRGDTPFKRTINAEPSDNFGFTIYRSKSALKKRRLTEAIKRMVLPRRLRTRPGWERQVETLNLSLRHRGLIGTIAKPLASLISWLYTSEKVSIYRLAGNKAESSSRASTEFAAAEIKEFDLDRYLSFSGIVPESELDTKCRKMLDRGYKCILLEHSGMPVASAWYKIGGEVILENSRKYELTERQAMIAYLRSTEAFDHLEPISQLLAAVVGKTGAETEEFLAAVPINRSEDEVLAHLSQWQRIEVNSCRRFLGMKHKNII